MNEKEISELAREEKNLYSRQWRAKNPDKVRRSNELYWARRAARRKEAEANAQNENH